MKARRRYSILCGMAIVVAGIGIWRFKDEVMLDQLVPNDSEPAVSCDSRDRVYGLDMNVAGDSGESPALFGSQAAIELEVSGELVSNCHRVGDSLVEAISLHLTVAKHKGTGFLGPASEAAVLSGDVPVTVIRGRHGQVMSVSVPKSLNRIEANIVGMIVNNLDYFYRPGKESYQEPSSDWIGPYAGDYSIRHQAGEAVLSLEKSYSVHADVRQEILNQSHQIRFSGDGVAKSIDIALEVETLRLKRRLASNHMRFHLVLKDAGAGSIAVKSGRAASNVEMVTLSAADRERDLNHSMYENTLAGRSWDDALLLLEKVQSDKNAETNLFLLLQALFFLQPETVAKAVAYVQDLLISSPALQITVQALYALGDVNCQSGLITIMDRADDLKTKMYVIGQMGLLKIPADNAVDKIAELTLSDESDVANTAWLALGNLAETDSHSPTWKERRDRNVAKLIQRYDDAQSEDEIMSALSSLGNSGYEGLTEIAASYVESGHMQMAQTALTTLRFVASQRATDLLMAMLAHAEKAIVEVAAAELRYRRLDKKHIDLIGRAFSRQADESIRLSLLQALKTVVESRQEIPFSVKSSIENDPSAEVRQLAEEVFSGAGI